MDQEMQEFQSRLLDGITQLQMRQHIPRRLVLGQQDYAVFERIKQLYPDYPNVIRVEGREQRWGMEIQRVPAQQHFEVCHEDAG
jgi:hypothetical protein